MVAVSNPGGRRRWANRRRKPSEWVSVSSAWRGLGTVGDLAVYDDATGVTAIVNHRMGSLLTMQESLFLTLIHRRLDEGRDQQIRGAIEVYEDTYRESYGSDAVVQMISILQQEHTEGSVSDAPTNHRGGSGRFGKQLPTRGKQ